MNWDKIKKIVTDNQNGNDWDAAYILKFKNSDFGCEFMAEENGVLQKK